MKPQMTPQMTQMPFSAAHLTQRDDSGDAATFRIV
jgi:hypothetical protein